MLEIGLKLVLISEGQEDKLISFLAAFKKHDHVISKRKTGLPVSSLDLAHLWTAVKKKKKGNQPCQPTSSSMTTSVFGPYGGSRKFKFPLPRLCQLENDVLIRRVFLLLGWKEFFCVPCKIVVILHEFIVLCPRASVRPLFQFFSC